MKKPKKDIEYVELYAEKMKRDNSLFKQQKMLTESQMNASRSLFKARFSDKSFEKEARNYLKKIGMINPLIRGGVAFAGKVSK